MRGAPVLRALRQGGEGDARGYARAAGRGYGGERMAAPELKERRARAGSRHRARTLRSTVAAVPAPLAALLAIVVIAGIVWALFVPPWQSPDETAHFAYAQSIAERHALPGKGPHTYSADQLLADFAVGGSAVAFRSTQIRPDWSKHDEALYLAAAGHASRTDGGGFNPAASNPPLYYVYADLAYWATSGGNAFDRYYAMRLWGISLLVLTVVGAWLLIGEVLGPRRLPQLAGSAVVGLLPMNTFISTSVNPDAMVITLWTFALWLGARVIKRAARPGDVIGLCAVTTAAILSKGSSYALVPAAALALLIGWVRCDGPARRSRGLLFALVAAVCVLPVLGWIELARSNGIAPVNAVGKAAGAPVRPFNLRQFLSYVWQFYLPRLPGMSPDRVTSGLPVYDIWLRRRLGGVRMARGEDARGGLRPRWPLSCRCVAIASAAIVATFRDRLRWAAHRFLRRGARRSAVRPAPDRVPIADRGPGASPPGPLSAAGAGAARARRRPGRRAPAGSVARAGVRGADRGDAGTADSSRWSRLERGTTREGARRRARALVGGRTRHCRAARRGCKQWALHRLVARHTAECCGDRSAERPERLPGPDDHQGCGRLCADVDHPVHGLGRDPARANSGRCNRLDGARRCDERQRLARGQIAAGYVRAIAPIVALDRTIPSGRRIQVCLRSRGPGTVDLMGAPLPNHALVEDDGTASGSRQAAIALLFLRPHPRSVLSLVPTIFARASLFRPGWVGPGPTGCSAPHSSGL